MKQWARSTPEIEEFRKILNDVPPKPRVISRINSINLAQTLTLLRDANKFKNLHNLYLQCGTKSLVCEDLHNCHYIVGLHCKLLWYEPHRFEKWWILHSLRLGEGDTITILSSWPMSPSDRVHPLGTITWHHYAAEWMAPSSPSPSFPFLEQLSPIYPEVLQPIRGPPAFIYYLLVICQEANGSKWTPRPADPERSMMQDLTQSLEEKYKGCQMT